jgi:predicted O-linked N-acetylglucosamine transferase (SPINDLY family)
MTTTMAATDTEDPPQTADAAARGSAAKPARPAKARAAAPRMPKAPAAPETVRSPLAAAAAAAFDPRASTRAVPVDPQDEASLREALKRAPDDPVLWGNLGRVLRQRGETDEAIECYRRATALPQAPGAVWFNLGNALMETRQHEDALQALDEAVRREPAMLPAQLQRARCLVRLDRMEEARDAYANLLRADEKEFNAWLELGNVCRKLGKPERAAECYGLAAECRPGDHRGHLAAARALDAMGAHEKAAAHYHRAIVASGGKPKALAELHHQMGRFRLDDGDVPRALESLRQASMAARLAGEAMELDASCEIRIDLADALMRLGLMDNAHGVMQQASAAQSEATLVRLAQTAFRFNQWEGALAVLRRNCELHPDSALAYYNLAHMLAECSMLEEALVQLQKAESLAEEPLSGATSLRGAIAGRTGDADQALALYKELSTGPEADRMRSSAAMSSLYSDTLTPMQVAELHRELFAPLAEGARPRASFANPRTADRPLRVGLITADFHHQHPVNIFMQPVLARWDHERFPLTTYFCGISHDDQTTQAKARSDAWREVTHFTAGQMARQIEDDRIDILFDLAGHTGQQRIAMFARRMAPVQVTFLGYPGSTGAPNMDWILGDPVVTPPEADALCSEKVWRLPNTVFCYSPEIDYPFPRLGPEAARRPLTFASFNNIAKLTPHSVGLWARILQAVPGSQLLLKAPSFGDALAQQRYRQMFSKLGVDPARLLFRGATPLHEMMAEYGDVDIALDPVPYNGGTTTLQAMWQGVPVVVKAGGHFVSRMGASFMTAAGLPDWVAADDDAYVEIARRMAADRGALLELKRGLRVRQLARPGWDIDGYAADFGRALEGMWRDWCETPV